MTDGYVIFDGVRIGVEPLPADWPRHRSDPMTDHGFTDADMARLTADSQMDQAQEATKNVARLAAVFCRQCLREKDVFGRSQALALTAAFVSSYVSSSIQKNGNG